MIEDVWTTDKEVHLGFVGTIKDMLKENLFPYSDYEGDTWLFLPSMGVMHHAQYGRSKEEALEPLKREVGEVILATPRTEEKALLLKSMHEIISHLNNEDAYDQWIYTVPDGASDEDFHEIAEDPTLFQDSCQLFVCLMNDYLEDGIYIGQQLFSMKEGTPTEVPHLDKIEYEQPVGRIDFLGFGGKVSESIEYRNVSDFLNTIKKENDCGAPMIIVLYRDKDGKTIAQNFLSQLDPPPQGIRVEDYQPVGRIDFLEAGGIVEESIVYTDESKFLDIIKKETSYGTPMNIVLYQNKDGKTISQNFLSQLDPPPQGIRVEDYQPSAIEPEHDPAPYVITTPWELRQLCIDKNWFTGGTCEQYDKLFYANSNGCPMEEIATIIWVCSDDVDRSDILAALKLEQEKYHQAISPQEQDQSMER